ncbi:amidase [Microbacterium sp. ISL-103]|uniref:amidase n=1 Tax=Microbacterium sp. ISL-103 TaxID=2819156 RepID=UPI001BEBC9F2|nr:amidase [Microbacterium sp. ISL-103]MBT2474922.1 amidase [Microbacterium sp. ISL-103]
MVGEVWRTASDLAQMYRAGEYSPVDAVETALHRIESVDGSINSMVTVTADLARARAREAEARFQRGDEVPALYGVPITVKDLTDTAGVRTTYGSTVYANHVPDTDALAWARLKDAGAILIGKTTTPEFGMLGVTESRLTGSTSTPWAPGHASGGSSGGAAASVAAGIVPLGWGSDGGGSIRVPASLCGVVGIKPSTGRIPHADNSDPDGTEGPLARTVLDAALMLDATAGRHPADRFTIPTGGEVFADAARRPGDLRGWRIAATTNPAHGPVDPQVAAAFDAALADLRLLGATVETVELTLPDPFEYFLAYWGAEFEDAVRELSAAGDVWPSIVELARRAQDLTPQRVSYALREEKTQIYNAFARTFQSYDLIVTPTTPTTSFPHCADLGGKEVVGGTKIANPGPYLHRLTEAPSHAGLPAISVPAGFSDTGLPVGLQLVAPLYEDSRAIYAAARFEAATAWHTMHPSLDATRFEGALHLSSIQLKPSL